jgi:hypothetical protein
MRRAARTDANQTELVDALRAVGATVQPLHAVGMGCPDLMVGYRGTNYLIEVKDGNKVPSKRKLTADQVNWHKTWQGQKSIATTPTEALAIIGVTIK